MLELDWKTRPDAKELVLSEWFKRGSIMKFTPEETISINYKTILKENELVKALKSIFVFKVMSHEQKE